MATIFSAPTIGEPRAVGIKNGGIAQVETDIVRPMSRLSTDDDTFQPGKQMEFRWRSDSSRYWSPRDTRLYVRYRLQFGEPHDGTPLPATAPLDMTLHQDKVRTVRVTAAPNTVLFDGGMRYLQNNVTIEHQPHPYTSAMAQLLTKTDIAGTDTGSAGLLSLRKDVNKSLQIVQRGAVAHVANTAAQGMNAGNGLFSPGSGGTFHRVPTVVTKADSSASTATGLTLSITNDASVVGIGDGQNVSVHDAGFGYEVNDIIRFNYASPNFPAALNDLGGVQSVNIVTAGSGYSSNLDAVLVTTTTDTGVGGNQGQGCTLRISTNVQGAVTAAVVVSTGRGYVQNAILIPDPTILQGGSNDLALRVGAVVTPFQTVVLDLLKADEQNNKADAINPKQEIVTAGVDGNATTFEYMQPMFLASWQHGFAVGPSDHQLFLTVSNDWFKDLLHCPQVHGAVRRYDETEVGTSSSKDTPIDQGKVRIYVEEVELHVAYVKPTQQFIPPSQSLRFSQYQVDTRVADTRNVNESLVVNPGTRQVLFGMRQEEHGIKFDREEFGLAMAGIDEAGTGQPMAFFTDFQVQLGGVVAPTVAFSNMNPGKAHMARPYQEFLNVIGKPLGLRGNTFTYAEYIGSHNSNGPSGPGLGDHGPIIALRLLTPESELSNELQIRGALSDDPKPLARQQMVIITIADRLLDLKYAPPQEIPVSTAVNDLL